MIILHITDILNPEGNGVAVAVEKYIKYENKSNEVGVFNLQRDIKIEDGKIFNFKDYKNISDLPKPFCNPDLIIFNEVYKPKYIKMYKECLKMNIKYIIIPHGCLVSMAQKKHKIKKILGNILLFNSFIKNAKAIQFLNESEKNNTNFKYRRAIISGNGIEFQKEKNNWNNKDKDLVFIGRYEIKHKGLDLIAKVCYENHKWFIDNNIKIQLYGRNSCNDLEKLRKIIERENIGDILIINGPAYDKEKKDILTNAFAFIQCSRYEGQPMGIIEALSLGLPCIVTYGTYMGDYIQKEKCGLACEFNSNDVFNAIKRITNDVNLRNEFSENSFFKANQDFIWENIIDNVLNEYKKI